MRQSKTLTMSRCALFTALVAISAYIQIPVPFMDYFTLQFFFVLLAGMILGKKQGAISVGLYVLIGLLGVPVFAAGGGIGYIFKPSFGYLLGFIVTSYAVGYTIKKNKCKKIWSIFNISFCRIHNNLCYWINI